MFENLKKMDDFLKKYNFFWLIYKVVNVNRSCIQRGNDRLFIDEFKRYFGIGDCL